MIVSRSLDQINPNGVKIACHVDVIERIAKESLIIDRSTPTGQLIDQYLRGQIQLEDHAVHLLFSANRWEAA